jgi:tricarballylate dehydrogenase
MSEDVYDVLVVGAGNAGLCAALAAHKAGSRVILLEKGPKSSRGGNTRFAGGGFRFTYNGLEDIRPMLPELSDQEASRLEIGSYTSQDYFDDVMQVTEYAADKNLSRILVDEANRTVHWLTEMNVKWNLATSTHAIKMGGKIRFPMGRVISVNEGGHGLVEMLFGTAQKKDIDIRYEAKAVKFLTDKRGNISGVRIQTREGMSDIMSRTVVLASGGFEANTEMRTRYLGSGWDVVKVRGTRNNTGETMMMALGLGAQSTGQWSGCHAVLLGADSPDMEAASEHLGRSSYPYGILVDMNGKRFVDEGEDFFSYTYAKFGREILQLPWRTAFQVFDSNVKSLLRPEYNRGTCISADSIEALARKLPDLEGENFVRTVKEFNEATQDSLFDPSKKDGKSTKGITPVKSNWAQRLDSPPFYAYPVTCGITFTFGGLKITEKAEVVDTEGNIIKGLYGAGEITGGSFYHNYPGGAGLMKGAVFGRIAGTSAAMGSKS